MQGESNDSAKTASAVADEYIDVDDYYTPATSAGGASAGALCRWLITFSWRWFDNFADLIIKNV